MHVTGLLTLLAIGLAIALALAVWFVMHRISHPPRRTSAWALAKGRPSDPSELDEPLEFRAFDLSLACKGRARKYPAWEITGKNPDGPVAIMTPGWGDSRLGMLARIDAIASECSRIVAWDPPGHGEAPGRWTMGVREPAMLLHTADMMREATGRRCVLFGSSAGGGVSVVTAAMDAQRDDNTRAVAGVIAEAPYRFPQVPARNVIRQAGYPWAINGPIAFALMGRIEGVGPKWRGFDRADHASIVRTPLLVIHGSEDAVCPLEDGRTIANNAGGELVVVEGAGHNDLWKEPPMRMECVDAVRRYLRSLNDG